MKNNSFKWDWIYNSYLNTLKQHFFLLHLTTSYDIMNGFNICFPDFCFFVASKVEKICHKVSVIHMTHLKLYPIQIIVSDTLDQAVTN